MARLQLPPDAVGLSELKIPLQKVAPLTVFQTRAKETLAYRVYPAWSENLLVLIHGIGGDSRYLAILASAISAAGLATVVTPDLRRHGELPHGPRATVKSSSQLEQDLEECLIHVRQSRPAQKIFWAGHSLGAALALRMALGAGSFWNQGLLMVAPFFNPDLHLNEPNYGGWISRDGDLIRVHMPEAYRTGSEVLEYEGDFVRAALPGPEFAQKWSVANFKSRVILAQEDRVLNAERAQAFLGSIPSVQSVAIPGSHLGIVARPASVQFLVESLEGIL